MDYTLTIHIDPQKVAAFKNTLKLCIAFGVNEGGQTQYSVVAVATEINPNITINWRDNFQIAATNDSFNVGAKFTSSTTIQNISLSSAYTLPVDWTDKRPNPDPKAPKDGFRFISEIPSASPILYKKVQGQPTPIWRPADGQVSPTGAQNFSPTGGLKLWFGQEQQGSMIRNPQDNYHAVNTIGSSTKVVQYGSDGQWSDM